MKQISVCISMPAYDTMQVGTCLSLIKLMDKFTAAKIKTTVQTFKCPYVGYGRNVLAAMFLETGFACLFNDANTLLKSLINSSVSCPGFC